MNDAGWLKVSHAGVLLNLHVQPGAKRSEVVGLHGAALKIRLAAPPVDGKANACLVSFLAETLRLSRSSISLISGQSSRSKRVTVTNLAADEVRNRLLPG
jgi:uncharacterized protein (TIGR00251 family)